MVDPVTVVRLVGGILLLFANGFFVTTEFAMTRVPQFDPAEFEGHPGLERALAMTERLEIYLSGCQVGITISSVGLGVVAEPAASAVLDAGLRAVGVVPAEGAAHSTLAILLALGIINILHVIVGEQAPTYLGVERSKFVAKYGARPLFYWSKLMAPVIRVADWTAKGLLGLFGITISRSWTEEELDGETAAEEPLTRRGLRRRMGRILSKGELPAERREEVLNALRIGDIPVAEIRVPRDEMVWLDATAPPTANLETMRDNPQFTRFPLFEAEPDAETLVGIVYATTVLRDAEAIETGDRTLTELAAPPVTVPADLSVSALIDHLQAQNAELAVVLEGDDVIGLVTISDAFEAIAGQVEDPMDYESRPVPRDA